MIYVLDTHPMIWFVSRDPRLSPAAKTAMLNPASALVVPTMALVEVQFLYAKRRIPVAPAAIRQKILGSANCKIHPLDEQVVSQIPTSLNIHDSIIVATALVYRDIFHQPVTLITKDSEISRSGLIQTLW